MAGRVPPDAQIGRVLLPQGTIEIEALLELLLDRGRNTAFFHERPAGCHADEKKRDGDDAEQHAEKRGAAPEDEGDHVTFGTRPRRSHACSK